jgi:uncharacterized integral membrane protein
MSDPNPSPTTRMQTPGSEAGSETPAATIPEPTEPAPPTEPPSEPPPQAVAPVPSSPPSWHTPDRGNPGRWGSIILGLILLAIGIWFFAEQTLGLDLPTLRWSQLWPLVLIAIGGWILLAQVRRGSR